MAGITILRSVLLLLLIPALLSWFISFRFRTRLLLTSFVVYGTTLILFFVSIWISPQKNLPGFVANRQAEYFKLRGNTRFDLDTLEPSFKSYISILPQSINNSFFRPYLWEAKGFFQIGAALETILLLLLFIVFLWKKEAGWKQRLQHPLIVLPSFFAITLFIFIGYTIPFPGAIIRYKIPAELLLFITLILLIDWKKLYKLK
jgi:integral membrane sensor domain MASE1